MNDIDDLALTLPCPFCGAEPTYWCVTVRVSSRPPGMLTTWLHQARSQVLQEAWRIGWGHGRNGAFEMAAQSFDAARQGHHWAKTVPPASEEVVAWLREQVNR